MVEETVGAESKLLEPSSSHYGVAFRKIVFAPTVGVHQVAANLF